MRLATYTAGGKQEIGVFSRDGGRVLPLHALGFDFSSMLDLIERHTPGDLDTIRMAAESGGGKGLPAQEITLCAPIPKPRHDLICMGQNYVEHAIESARFLDKQYEKPPHPVYFSKRAHEAVPTNGIIPLHSDITGQLDYECELAVIIGKTCFRTPKQEVYNHVFGYTIVNDVSARDLQRNHKQFMFGKSLDGATPMGPVIVTADEIGAPPHLRISTRVNGELRQDGDTRDFIYDIPTLLSILCAGVTLYPGDIISTGTPAGVGAGLSPPVFLRPGDVVECEIEKIGILRNVIGSEGSV